MSSIIKQKSFDFAIKIVELSQKLISEKREYVLSKQIIRSGTAIGALVREALNAESTADFIHKLGIAQKETDETCYWLELLQTTKLIENHIFERLHTDCNELLKIIKSIIITSKQKLQKEKEKK